MNKERRKDLSKAMDKLYEGKDLLQSVLEEEQNAFDNMPEGLQQSERGETMEEGISAMEEFLYAIEEGLENLEDLL